MKLGRNSQKATQNPERFHSNILLVTFQNSFLYSPKICIFAGSKTNIELKHHSNKSHLNTKNEMKCYICLTDSVVGRPDYFDLLKVTLESARKNTSLRLICLYEGTEGDAVCQLLKEYDVEIIFHPWPFKQELMDIYPKEWMIEHYGKVIDYNRIFGTFMRMEIPAVEQEDTYVLYSDIDVIFTADIRLEELPHPAVVAAAPETDRNGNEGYFNAGVLVINVEGMRAKREQFVEMMKKRQRNASGIFDQGYLNELCYDEMDNLPLEYNWKPYWGINDDAKIIHFHGMKPNCKLFEAGFNTDNSFFRFVFDNTPDGFAGYIYYFNLFYKYLNRPNDRWLYNHLQEIYHLFRIPEYAFPEQFYLASKRLKRYKRRYKHSLIAIGILSIALVASLIIL